MKKSARTSPEWKKGETRPCPTGKCKHPHVKGSGPCTQIGCGCHGSYGKQKGGR